MRIFPKHFLSTTHNAKNVFEEIKMTHVFHASYNFPSILTVFKTIKLKSIIVSEFLIRSYNV